MIRSELIGKYAKVIFAGKEIQGKIIDETKNTLIIRTKYGDKKIIKMNSKITVESYKMNGSKISKRPEDRIKLK